MEYNLTDKQKDLLRWLVQQARAGNLSEEFHVVWIMDSGEISGFRGDHPEITKGMLDALHNAELLLCVPNFKTSTSTSGKSHPKTTYREVEINRRCTITRRAYEAVDSDFELSTIQTGTHITIGAIIQTMSGGNVQAVGIAQDAEISQIVNDADLLRSQIEALTENLLNEVKPALEVDDLAEYAQTIRELKEQLLAQKPDASLIQRLVRTLSLLGDIEGTIGLMTRVWPFLHPLLLIAAARLGLA